MITINENDSTMSSSGRITMIYTHKPVCDYFPVIIAEVLHVFEVEPPPGIDQSEAANGYYDRINERKLQQELWTNTSKLAREY